MLLLATDPLLDRWHQVTPSESKAQETSSPLPKRHCRILQTETVLSPVSFFRSCLQFTFLFATCFSMGLTECCCTRVVQHEPHSVCKKNRGSPSTNSKIADNGRYTCAPQTYVCIFGVCFKFFRALCFFKKRALEGRFCFVSGLSPNHDPILCWCLQSSTLRCNSCTLP